MSIGALPMAALVVAFLTSGCLDSGPSRSDVQKRVAHICSMAIDHPNPKRAFAELDQVDAGKDRTAYRAWLDALRRSRQALQGALDRIDRLHRAMSHKELARFHR